MSYTHIHTYLGLYIRPYTYRYTYTFLPSSCYVCMKLLRFHRSTIQMYGLFAKFFPLHCFLFYFLLLPSWQQNTWNSLDKDKLSFRLCQFGEFNLSLKKEMDFWPDLQSWHPIGSLIPSAQRPVIDLDFIAHPKRESLFWFLYLKFEHMQSHLTLINSSRIESKLNILRMYFRRNDVAYSKNSV
jgi:hypothetical protein